MRQLHPVSIKERFVASGVYTFSQAGVVLPVKETWTIHELPDYSQLIRVDREEKAVSGMTLLLEILRSSTGQVERFDSQFYGDDHRSVRQSKATFAFFEERVQLGRRLGTQPQENTEMILPAATLIYPNAYVLLGSVIAAATQSQEEAKVFSFGLDDDNLYVPQIHGFEASPVDETADEILTNSEISPYQIVYKNYDKNSRFWLDKYHMIVRMENRQLGEPLIMTLTQYSRRPDKDHD